MNGRVSPYNTRNVKQDVASAIVSAGLLGKFGGELLKVVILSYSLLLCFVNPLIFLFFKKIPFPSYLFSFLFKLF